MPSCARAVASVFRGGIVADNAGDGGWLMRKPACAIARQRGANLPSTGIIPHTETGHVKGGEGCSKKSLKGDPGKRASCGIRGHFRQTAKAIPMKRNQPASAILASVGWLCLLGTGSPALLPGCTCHLVVLFESRAREPCPYPCPYGRGSRVLLSKSTTLCNRAGSPILLESDFSAFSADAIPVVNPMPQASPPSESPL